MTAPVVDADLYGPDALVDSRDLFARIREAGPVVWLPRHRMYAMGRFDDVRAALRDDALFRSGHGVAANPLTNALARDTTLNSDDDVHTARRRVLMRSLGAKAIGAVEPALAREAQDVVEDALRRPHVEAAGDVASRLPSSVVATLVGVDGGSTRLLRWAAATFETSVRPTGAASAPCRAPSASTCSAAVCVRTPSRRAAGRRRSSTPMRGAS